MVCIEQYAAMFFLAFLITKVYADKCTQRGSGLLVAKHTSLIGWKGKLVVVSCYSADNPVYTLFGIILHIVTNYRLALMKSLV